MQESQVSPSEHHGNGFNYCKFSKAVVAIPLFPIIAFIAASFFENPVAQITAAGLAILVTIKLAVWLDNIPLLQKRIIGISGLSSKE